jgi:acetoin utilization protein AcuB
MTTHVLTATPTTEIHELARVMLAERISALPIIDGNHTPVGIVTITDILRCVMLRAPLELWT